MAAASHRSRGTGGPARSCGAPQGQPEAVPGPSTLPHAVAKRRADRVLERCWHARHDTVDCRGTRTVDHAVERVESRPGADGDGYRWPAVALAIFPVHTKHTFGRSHSAGYRGQVG